MKKNSRKKAKPPESKPAPIIAMLDKATQILIEEACREYLLLNEAEKIIDNVFDKKKFNGDCI